MKAGVGIQVDREGPWENSLDRKRTSRQSCCMKKDPEQGKGSFAGADWCCWSWQRLVQSRQKSRGRRREMRSRGF